MNADDCDASGGERSVSLTVVLRLFGTLVYPAVDLYYDFQNRDVEVSDEGAERALPTHTQSVEASLS